MTVLKKWQAVPTENFRFQAILKDYVGDKECEDIAMQIMRIRGVVSVAFNEAGRQAKQILVTYHGLSHQYGEGVQDRVREIPGIKKTEF